MEIGLIFALLTAISFAMTSVFLRRGMFRAGESFSALVITVFIGTLYFSLAVTFTGEWNKVWSLSWQGWVLLGGAGVIHFILGRFLTFTCIRLIGSNKSATLTRTSIFFAVILAVIFLSESLSLLIVLGILFIAGGAALVSIEKKGVNAEKQSELSTKTQTKGIISGLAAGFFWGVSPILVKPGIEEIGSPSAGAFVSFVFAFLILAGLLIRKGQRERLVKLPRSSFIWLIIAGVFQTTAQLFRYTALSYSPVSLVEPFISIQIVLILFFSFLLNRKLEVFSWKVIVGMVAATVGTILLSYRF